MNTARSLELGRPVTVADVARVHPGKPDRCLCRGTAEVPMANRLPGQHICGKALAAFRKQCGARVQDTDRGPRWKLGMSPEEWGLAQIFHADLRHHEWRDKFNRRMKMPSKRATPTPVPAQPPMTAPMTPTPGQPAQPFPPAMPMPTGP